VTTVNPAVALNLSAGRSDEANAGSETPPDAAAIDGRNAMLPKHDGKALKDRPRPLDDTRITTRPISWRSPLTKFGIGAFVAAIVVVGPGGAAHAAGENPPAGLLAKIQIATQATNTTTTLSRARTQRSKRPQVVGKSK
jgi:negative regulator of sigma E activity